MNIFYYLTVITVKTIFIQKHSFSVFLHRDKLQRVVKFLVLVSPAYFVCVNRVVGCCWWWCEQSEKDLVCACGRRRKKFRINIFIFQYHISLAQKPHRNQKRKFFSRRTISRNGMVTKKCTRIHVE